MSLFSWQLPFKIVGCCSCVCPSELFKRELKIRRNTTKHPTPNWNPFGNPLRPCSGWATRRVTENLHAATRNVSLSPESWRYRWEMDLENKCPCQPAENSKPGYFYPSKGWTDTAKEATEEYFWNETVTTNRSLFWTAFQFVEFHSSGFSWSLANLQFRQLH